MAALGDVGSPIPRDRIVATADRLGGANSERDIFEKVRAEDVALAKSFRPITSRAHGSQVDRAVSPTAGVVDLGRGSAADRT
jgi:hypothetical protein